MDGSEANSSTEDVLRNLGLFTREGELKNAAILLFGKHVGQFFPSAVFKIGRFHTDESDLIIQDVIEGNLIQMASRVMEVLRTKYLLSPIHYEACHPNAHLRSQYRIVELRFVAERVDSGSLIAEAFFLSS